MSGGIGALERRVETLEGLTSRFWLKQVGLGICGLFACAGIALTLYIAQRDTFLPPMTENTKASIKNGVNIEHLLGDVVALQSGVSSIQVDLADSKREIINSNKQTRDTVILWGEKLNLLLNSDN